MGGSYTMTAAQHNNTGIDKRNTLRVAVVLLSGGLDSATAAAWVLAQGWGIAALTIDYGQRHRCELDAAQRVAKSLGIREHKIISVDLSQFGGSALTSANISVADTPLDKIGSTIPSTYVPARNTVFLSLALAYAETLAAADIVIGANAVDYSGYPDCREEYLNAFTAMARLGTKAGVEGVPLTIHAPLLTMTKGEIIRAGLSWGVNYAFTHTCYNPHIIEGTSEAVDVLACSRCEACLLRLHGFAEAGMIDPLRYMTHDRLHLVNEYFH